MFSPKGGDQWNKWGPVVTANLCTGPHRCLILLRSSPKSCVFLHCVHPTPSASLVIGARVLQLQESGWLCCCLGPGLPLWQSSPRMHLPQIICKLQCGAGWTGCFSRERNHCILFPRGCPLETLNSLMPPVFISIKSDAAIHLKEDILVTYLGSGHQLDPTTLCLGTKLRAWKSSPSGFFMGQWDSSGKGTWGLTGTWGCLPPQR